MELVEKTEAIRKLGVPLPTINYDYKGYESIIIKNLHLGGVRGVEVPEIHETFEEGCDRIIEWWGDEDNLRG